MKTNLFIRYGLIILAMAIVTMSCGMPQKQPDPTATIAAPIIEQPVQPIVQPTVQEPVEQPTIPAPSLPTAEPREIPTQPPLPTETDVLVVDEPLPYFTEEFDGDIDSWSYFMMNGKEDNMDLYTEEGYLVFDLQGQNQWVYLTYDEYSYSDVLVEVLADNRGKNNNNVSLVCRYSDEGWYEFTISNNGLYWIYAYSELVGDYVSLYNGGSTHIKMGKDINQYTAICEEQTLKLYINGFFEKEIVDKKHNFREGLVGVSVSSFETLPILVKIDYMTIDIP